MLNNRLGWNFNFENINIIHNIKIQTLIKKLFIKASSFIEIFWIGSILNNNNLKTINFNKWKKITENINIIYLIHYSVFFFVRLYKILWSFPPYHFGEDRHLTNTFFSYFYGFKCS